MSSNTFRKDLIFLMESYQFALQRTSNHMVWQHPSGLRIFTSSTPSCRHALNQIERDIRRKMIKNQ